MSDRCCRDDSYHLRDHDDNIYGAFVGGLWANSDTSSGVFNVTNAYIGNVGGGIYNGALRTNITTS